MGVSDDTKPNPNSDGYEGEEMVEATGLRQRNRLNGANGTGEEEAMTVEQAFESKPVPSWREQLTFRAFFVAFFLAVLFSVIVMKLNLTTGIIPSLNVSAGLLGFFFVRMWTVALEKWGLLKQPFTRQENTVIQTAVVAAYGLAFSGGFGSYIFGMSSRIAAQATEANNPEDIKDPKLSWLIGFMFCVSFIGLFALVPMRKIMIIDYKLIYPSGTATAYLINGFHTPEGAKLAKRQVKTLGKFFAGSFFWGFFQWFYTGGDGCGFSSFPTLGLKAFKNKFFFDFSPTYVGVGMICPYIVNVSVLLGGIISWGLMWPLINNKKGEWYSASLSPTSLHGLQGYKIQQHKTFLENVQGTVNWFGDRILRNGKQEFLLILCFVLLSAYSHGATFWVFISIAMILGDGLYNFVKVFSHTLSALYKSWRTRTNLPITDSDGRVVPAEMISFDDKRRTELFLKDQIPLKLALGGYICVAIISIVTLPHIFDPLKWYYILVVYLLAPILAFCNAYGCGLTDWSLASTYGKLAIFTIGAWAGKGDGGVLAGLAACGVMMSIVSTAADLMQDFKTGYLTLASPRSMFISQIIGTAMGCVIAPCIFWLFYKAFGNLGLSGSEYPAPYAIVYRNMAILGVDGFGSLPHNCLKLCYGFFCAAIFINAIRDLVPGKISRFIPLPMAMAIPFYIGPYFAIDMFIGSVILFIWEKVDKVQADQFGPAVASGMICGDGLWTLPQSILSLAKVNPPICMKFLSRQANEKVDAFLGS